VPSPTPQDTATPTALPCLQDGGQIVVFDDFKSPAAGENIRYRVYIPPCYQQTQARYPYVILLPGLQQDEKEWGNLGIQQALDQGIRLNALAPMIVVMPTLGKIGTDDSFPPKASYETVVLDELVPAVERDFCTWNQRDHRAIGGISRGGFWAYSIALRHPDEFGIVGGHSAAFASGNAPAANNPLELALNAPFLSSANLRMYLDNGAEDPAGTNLELFSNRLSSRGIAHTYIISPVGGHDDAYWSAHLQDYLTFYGKDWPRQAGDLPSCLQPSP
jgi:enterochelin esterase-like enzyme